MRVKKLKKITTLLVCTIVITTLIPIIAIAGDEENPEISDGERDITGLFGMLFPRFFTHIDITAGWFYENITNPDTLYVALKVKDLEYKKLRAIYSIHWEYNEKPYAAGLHTDSNGAYFIAYTGLFEPGNETIYEIETDFNHETNIITWTIPKEYIGNPISGEILELPFAWNGIRFISDTWIQLFMKLFGDSEIAKDWAYGHDYTIQY